MLTESRNVHQVGNFGGVNCQFAVGCNPGSMEVLNANKKRKLTTSMEELNFS